MSQDLEKFGMPEEELFAPVDHSDLESEKITAPRYSYWHSVFRVFFKKKIKTLFFFPDHMPAEVSDWIHQAYSIAFFMYLMMC